MMQQQLEILNVTRNFAFIKIATELCKTNILRKVVQFLRTRLHSPRLKARNRSSSSCCSFSLSHRRRTTASAATQRDRGSHDFLVQDSKFCALYTSLRSEAIKKLCDDVKPLFFFVGNTN